ncbi:MAG TPA: hypothetical protein VFA72_17810 [Burkholderiales bacterium]|nr:hypothetical protein [Burkholderiales bacterium]
MRLLYDGYLDEAPLEVSVLLVPPEVPVSELPLGALELSVVLGEVELAPLEEP